MIKNKMIGNENESEIELDLNSKFSKKFLKIHMFESKPVKINQDI